MPASCPRALRFIAALGAVLFAVVGLAACGGGIPGNAVVQVDGTPITKATFNTGWASAASSCAAATAAAKPVVPEPPDYTACIAHLKATARETGQRPDSADRSAAEDPVRTAVQIAAAGGARLPDLLAVGARRSRIAGREGQRQGSQEAVRENQDTSSSPRRPNSKNSSRPRARRVSDLLLRVKLNMLSSENPEEDRQRAKATSPRPKSRSTTTKTSRTSARRKSATCEIILTKTEAEAKSAKKEIESGKSFASVAKSKSRSTRPARPTAACCRKSSKARRRRRSTQRSSPPSRTCSSGPVKTPVRLLRLRGQEHHARQPADPRAGRRRRSSSS